VARFVALEVDHTAVRCLSMKCDEHMYSRRSSRYQTTESKAKITDTGRGPNYFGRMHAMASGFDASEAREGRPSMRWIWA